MKWVQWKTIYLRKLVKIPTFPRSDLSDSIKVMTNRVTELFRLQGNQSLPSQMLINFQLDTLKKCCQISIEIQKFAFKISTTIVWSGKAFSWWRHQMETLFASLALCERNSLITGDFSWLRPVIRSFDVFFDLHQNKRLSNPSWRRWFYTPSRPLRRHCKILMAYALEMAKTH